MPALTFDLISSQTLTSNQAQVDFNSFSGYTDLMIVGQWCPTTNVANDIYLQFNGDASSSYYYQQIVADSSTLVCNDSGGAQSTGVRVANNADAQSYNRFSAFEINIYEYSGTTYGKCVYSRWAGAANTASAGMFGGFWNNTNAVTSLTISTRTSTQLKSGSVFSLYGILRA